MSARKLLLQCDCCFIEK